jgi:Virulence factor BrkB
VAVPERWSTSVRLAHRGARRVDGWQRRHALAAFAVAVGRKFVDDRASGFAALIACYAFFSIFPLLLALTSILGFVLHGDPERQATIVDSVFAELPVVGPQIREDVSVLAGSGPALVIGVVLAVWAGLGVTLALSRAFDRFWGVPHVRRRHYFAARARGPGERDLRSVRCGDRAAVLALAHGAAPADLAEVNAVRALRLWPRSLGGRLPPLTSGRWSAPPQAQSDPRERIAVTFDEP